MFVWKKQIRQNGLVKLTSWPLALAPHFVNNDFVTAEITNRTMRECHEGLAWSQGYVL